MKKYSILFPLFLVLALSLVQPVAARGATLGDYVWRDTNRNGIQDPGEYGMPGIIVALSLWESGSWALVGTTQTSPMGIYTFEDLAAGTYRLQFSNIPADMAVSPANQGADDTLDSDADPAGLIDSIIIPDESTYNPNMDMGLYPVYCAASGDETYGDLGITGVAFNTGMNTSQIADYTDNTEYVFTTLNPGATYAYSITYMSYKEEPSNCLVSTFIDYNGNGSFDDGCSLHCGSYIIQPQAGPNIFSGTFTIPLNALPGLTRMRVVVFYDESGTYSRTPSCVQGLDGEVEDYTVEIGFPFLPPPIIGDRVWLDLNQNGIQDEGEPGIPGIGVNLYYETCTGEPFDSVITDAFGNYGFNNLDNGTYCIQFTNLTGWTVSPANQGGDDAIDSDATPGGQIQGIYFGAEVSDLTNDMGLYSEGFPGSIGGVVYCDDNGDRAFNFGEGVNLVAVSLYSDTDCDGNSDGSAIAVTQTLGDGHFIFINLQVGTTANPVCYVVEVDTGDMGLCNVPFTPVTYAVSLDQTNIVDIESIFGFSSQGSFTLGDRVWYDTNENGIQDPGEQGVAGIGATLYNNADCTGVVIDTTETDNSGAYKFEGINPGVYCIQFSGIPEGWTICPLNRLADDALDSDANPLTAQINNIVINGDDLNEDMGLMGKYVIPTVTGSGIIILSCLLAGSALRVIRRKKMSK